MNKLTLAALALGLAAPLSTAPVMTQTVSAQDSSSNKTQEMARFIEGETEKFIVRQFGTSVRGKTLPASATTGCDADTMQAIGAATSTCQSALNAVQKIEWIMQLTFTFTILNERDKKNGPAIFDTFATDIDTVTTAFQGREYPVYDVVLITGHMSKALALADIERYDEALSEIDTIERIFKSSQMKDPVLNQADIDKQRSKIRAQKKAARAK